MFSPCCCVQCFYNLCAFVAMLDVCVLYVSLWSSVTPKIVCICVHGYCCVVNL